MAKTRGLRLDDREIRKTLGSLSLAATNPKPAWDKFAQYMRVTTDSMFGRLRRGGTYRGVTWRDFKPQYTRKDGTVVPAHGGVPRVNGRGLVLGRKRPSGQRLAAGDSLMQDTGTLRARAALVVRQTDTLLELDPKGLRYAAHQDRMRPFLFFNVPKDMNVLLGFLKEHVDSYVRNRRGVGK